MVNLVEQNFSNHVYSFVADSVADIDKLPTRKSAGKDNLAIINNVAMGSDCLVIATGDLYMLSGTTDEGEWVVI